MVKDEPVLFIFNSPVESGCDYVMQTMKLVAKKRPAYGIALGDIVPLFRLLFVQDKWVIRKVHGCIVFRPISILPGVRYTSVRMLAYGFWAIAVRFFIAVCHRGVKKILWYFEPFHMPRLLAVYRGYTILYDCVDYYPGFSPSAKQQHTRCLRLSDRIFANSAPLSSLLRKETPNVTTVPLGFAGDLFRAHRVVPLPPRKNQFVVGYVGSISDRFDFDLLDTVARALPKTQFMLCGPIENNVFGAQGSACDRLVQLLRNTNVLWSGSVSKEEIPRVLSSFDCGIIPYRTDLDFNTYSFPMKVMEYFAAGLPVITLDIRALRQYHNRGLLYSVSSVSDFIKALKTVRRSGWSREKQLRQRAIAYANSWQRKVQQILPS